MTASQEYWQAFRMYFGTEMQRSNEWREAWRKGASSWSQWFEPRLGRIRPAAQNCNQPGEWIVKWKSSAEVKTDDLKVLVGYSNNADADMRTATASKSVLKNPGSNLLIIGPVHCDRGGSFQAWEWKDGQFVPLDGNLPLPLEVPTP